MTAADCIECGHLPEEHEDGECNACYAEGRDVLCDKWRDEPRGAGMEDGECFRGGEAAAFERDQQIAAQRLK